MPALSLPSRHPLHNKIAALPCDQLARATGFVRRAARKITPAGYLLSACLFALQAAPSLSALAQFWAVLHRQTLSKQAMHKRCSPAAVAFLQAVLQSVVGSLVTRPGVPGLPPGLFGRILVQDSTHLALPKKLARFFPGPANQNRKDQASLKIQATLDLLRNQWVQFRLTPFICNDQAAAPHILPELRKNDLVIRDLGYLVLAVLRQIHERGAFFLSRWRYGLQIAAPEDGQKVDLLKRLRGRARWDGPVLLGQEKLPVRLIAVRLPEPVAAERRRKAQANRDRRLQHSAEYLQLQGWAIFITNVPPERLAAKELIKLYGLRWRIEIIFKAWKSHFNLAQLTAGSAEQVLIVVLGKLLWITWFSVQFAQMVAQTGNVSLLKFAAWSARFVHVLFPPTSLNPKTLSELMQYYCRYDRRKKRLNFLEKCHCLG